MLILNMFMITGIYRQGDVGQGTCSPAVYKPPHPSEANVCTFEYIFEGDTMEEVCERSFIIKLYRNF